MLPIHKIKYCFGEKSKFSIFRCFWLSLLISLKIWLNPLTLYEDDLIKLEPNSEYVILMYLHSKDYNRGS